MGRFIALAHLIMAMGWRGSRVDDTSPRDRILTYIRQHPGQPEKTIRDLLGLTRGNLRYHLGQLERDNLVRSEKEGRSRVYYPEGVAGGQRDARGEERILHLVRNNPGIRKKKLARLSHMKQAQVNRLVLRLWKRRQLHRKRTSKGYCYYIMSDEDRNFDREFRNLIYQYLMDRLSEEDFRRKKRALDNLYRK